MPAVNFNASKDAETLFNANGKCTMHLHMSLMKTSKGLIVDLVKFKLKLIKVSLKRLGFKQRLLISILFFR